MEVLGEEFESFLSYIPEKLSLPELMRMISTEARAARVSVNGIGELQNVTSQAKQPGADHQFYEELGVEVGVPGTYAQILLFLFVFNKVGQNSNYFTIIHGQWPRLEIGNHQSSLLGARSKVTAM